MTPPVPGVPGVPGTVARAVLPAPFRAPPGVLVAATVLLLEPPERHHVTLDGQTHGYSTVLSAWLDPRDGTPRLAHLALERLALAAELAAEGLDPAPVEAHREAHVEALQPVGAGDSSLEAPPGSIPAIDAISCGRLVILCAAPKTPARPSVTPPPPRSSP